MQTKIFKKIVKNILLVSVIAVQSSFVQAAETVPKDEVIAKFIKEYGKPSATTEKVSAALRMFLAPVQAYTSEYKDLSTKAQAGVNMATDAVRIVNCLNRARNCSDDIQSVGINSFWFFNDLVSFVYHGYKAVTGKDLAIAADTDSELAVNGVDIKSARKIVRVLAAGIEGVTSVALSFTTGKVGNAATQAKLNFARALARSIERGLVVKSTWAQVVMAAVVLSHLNFFVKSLTKDYEKARDEEVDTLCINIRNGKISSDNTVIYRRHYASTLPEEKAKEVLGKIYDAAAFRKADAAA